MPDFMLERAFMQSTMGPVAGVDEAGRGPWAGPVCASVVIFPKNGPDNILAKALDDSKKLSAKQRQILVPEIQAQASWGIGWASVSEIDAINILQATFLAMRRALASLPSLPSLALIDGKLLPKDFPCATHSVIGGDGISLSIAAASILAKEARDSHMRTLATQYPGYGWETNAGYGTREHQQALQRLGPVTEHRKSFRPIYELFSVTA